MSIRRTKIIATMGPALDDLEELEKSIRAGVDVFRANFSHGTKEEHAKRFKLVREISQSLGKEVAILADLQGPKIRISRFKNKKIQLKEGAEFVLDTQLADDEGNEHQVGIDYKALVHDVVTNDTLLLDDGRIILTVKNVDGERIVCQVVVGGELSNNKGINRQGGGLSAAALTEKDKVDLKVAVELEADYIAVSFPRDAKDIQEARCLLEAEKSNAGIIAKIERVEAVENLAEITKESDAVMVARGDLGVEIGDAEVPAIQKKIIQCARRYDKVAITATQMMESMIDNPIPTRAEVSDVANAVLDNTDAVMLSAESAVGKHPHLVVEAMVRVCLAAEKQVVARTSKHRVECHFERIDEAIAMAAMYTANHVDVAAIISLTESGSTPLWMSRIRSGVSIYGLTRNIATQRKMNLYRGVIPVAFDMPVGTTKDLSKRSIETLKDMQAIKSGDSVIMTCGEEVGLHGGTNSLKVYKVE